MEQIEKYGIQVYPLPDCDDDEDEDYKEQCRQLKVCSQTYSGSALTVNPTGRRQVVSQDKWSLVRGWGVLGLCG